MSIQVRMFEGLSHEEENRYAISGTISKMGKGQSLEGNWAAREGIFEVKRRKYFLTSSAILE